VAIERVTDGDTAVLRGGQRLRLIGIDAPELRPSPEPYAREARAVLTEISGRVVGAQDGREPHDRYGRGLAHLYLAGGQNVQALLLRRGLATSLLVPPNDEHLSCYAAAEAEARAARRGIWSLPDFRPTAAARLGRLREGYRVVTGTVSAARCRRDGVWLRLDGVVAVKIGAPDLEYFKGRDLCRLRGRRVSVRGLVQRYRGTPRIRIRHPVYIELSPDEENPR
jgi:endonuclease YncB( thermonuclease family)